MTEQEEITRLNLLVEKYERLSNCVLDFIESAVYQDVEPKSLDEIEGEMGTHKVIITEDMDFFNDRWGRRWTRWG